MIVEIKELKGSLIIKTSIEDITELPLLLKTIKIKYYELLPDKNHVIVYF
ncbi:hypothetical protein [Petroclostridium sp. X23]|nr:hypothetical protein [Petroclostridium sp. X23]WHH57186.1 hypothetical protein QKW49_15215 [Petroclostridium sp. X23]